MDQHSTVVLTRLDQDLVCRCSNDPACPEIRIPQHLASNSKLLTQTVSSMKLDEGVEVSISIGRLQRWLEFKTAGRSEDHTIPPNELAIILQVSDFLNDEGCVRLVCLLLADHVVASTELKKTFTVSYVKAHIEPRILPISTSLCSIIPALEQLHEHLILQTLRFTLVVAPPFALKTDTRDPTMPAMWRHPDPENSLVPRIVDPIPTRALAVLLRHLPTSLHPLALLAACPSLPTHAALRLIFPDTKCAHAALLAAAELPYNISSLCFTGSFFGNQQEGLAFPEHQEEPCFHNHPDDPHPIALLPRLPALEALHLKFCTTDSPPNLYPVLARVLPQLSNLTFLSLQRSRPAPGHGFDTLWQQFSALKSLRTLDVSAIGLTQCAQILPGHLTPVPPPHHRLLHEFAACLTHLTALQTLVLQGNRLENDGWRILAPAAAQLPLQSLNLADCSVEEWPQLEGLGCDPETAFTSLTSLWLQASEQLGVESRTGSVQLHRCKHLREVRMTLASRSIAGNFFRSLKESPIRLETFAVHCYEKLSIPIAQEAAQCLCKWTGLKELNMDMLSYQDELSAAIVPALARLSALQSLGLPRLCKFEDYAPAVSLLTGLRSLCIEAVAVDSSPRFAESLLATFKRLSSLEELKISSVLMLGSDGNYFQGDYASLSPPEHTDAHLGIAAALGAATQLTHLTLANSRLGSHFATIYAGHLKLLEKLKVLHIPGTFMDPISMGTVALALCSMQKLQSLDLRWGNIGAHGARALAGVIRQLTELEELDVGFCGKKHKSMLSDKAMLEIHDALPHSIRRAAFRTWE